MKIQSFFKNVIVRCVGIIVKSIGKLIPIRKNQVFICSNSHGYNDSPRAISERILSDRDFDNFKIVWVLKNKSELPKQYAKRVEVVKPFSVFYFLRAVQSKYWISSVPIESFFSFKKKRQFI